MTLAEKQLTVEEKYIRLGSLKEYWSSLGVNTNGFNSIEATKLVDEVWVAANGEHQFDIVVIKSVNGPVTLETSLRIFQSYVVGDFAGAPVAHVKLEVLPTKRDRSVKRSNPVGQTFVGLSSISTQENGLVLAGSGFGVRITREGVFAQSGNTPKG